LAICEDRAVVAFNDLSHHPLDATVLKEISIYDVALRYIIESEKPSILIPGIELELNLVWVLVGNHLPRSAGYNPFIIDAFPLE